MSGFKALSFINRSGLKISVFGLYAAGSWRTALKQFYVEVMFIHSYHEFPITVLPAEM